VTSFSSITIEELGLPRFRGGLRAWDQGIGLDIILSSCFEPFFGSAPGGAILPSRPALGCGCRAQRRSRNGPLLGPPGGLVLDGREHGGRLVCVGTDCRRLMLALVIERRSIAD
jgi:hypothetical protein